MKKEVKLLKRKALNSLILCIEHFNRPSNIGRNEAVLILLDHSFEMLLKASILHKGGKIREPRKKQTIGFDACVRKTLSDGSCSFLNEEQALTLQTNNGLRDSAQHYLIDISEQHLYMQAQAGLTLFKDIFKKVFNEDLNAKLPPRVLPLSTIPPTDLHSFFDSEVSSVKQLLKPSSRKKFEATAKLRGLVIMESSLQGEKSQPSQGELDKIANDIKTGKSWNEIFPGVASINLTAKGTGPSIDLRFTKNEGIPIHIVPEGTPEASVLAIKRVDELGFYNLGRDQVSEKVGLTGPKTSAFIDYLNIKSNSECFKEFVIGKTRHSRYSHKAVEIIKNAMKNASVEDVWKLHGAKYRSGSKVD